jgi:hypothetical protein
MFRSALSSGLGRPGHSVLPGKSATEGQVGAPMPKEPKHPWGDRFGALLEGLSLVSRSRGTYPLRQARVTELQHELCLTSDHVVKSAHATRRPSPPLTVPSITHRTRSSADSLSSPSTVDVHNARRAHCYRSRITWWRPAMPLASGTFS